MFICPHQGIVSMEGAKLAISFPNYHHTSEISGGKLVEVRYYHCRHYEMTCNSCKVAKVPLLCITDLHSNKCQGSGCLCTYQQEDLTLVLR